MKLQIIGSPLGRYTTEGSIEMSMFRSYTETYDMNTESGAPTLLGIHTPIGKEPYNMLKPCFDMYRKYKYLGCDVTIVNSAKLPVSPESYSIQSGMVDIDPRDTLDPIMFKGAHGQDLGAVLNSMYGGLTSNVFNLSGMDKEKATALETFYYTALGDEAWRKSPIQKTLHIRNLHPIVYGLATQMQMQFNGIEPSGYPQNGSDWIAGTYRTKSGTPSSLVGNQVPNMTPSTALIEDFSDTSVHARVPVQLMTNKVQRLGWLDTRQVLGNSSTDDLDVDNITVLPKVLMGILMLPPARRAYNFLRVIIRHKWKFAVYRTVTTGTTDFLSLTNAIGYNNQYTGNTPSSSSKTLLLDSDPEQDVVEDDGIEDTDY